MASRGPFDTSGARVGAPRGGAVQVLAGRYLRQEEGHRPRCGFPLGGGRLTVGQLRGESFLAALRTICASAFPLRCFGRRCPHPSQDRGRRERGSEVSARGGRRVSRRHGQAPPGPHLLPQAGGRGWVSESRRGSPATPSPLWGGGKARARAVGGR